jgi:hypothetical protein
MIETFTLNDRERELILELLEAEHRNLPAEIRRTDSLALHEELQQRARLVDGLISRLHRFAVVGK